MPSPRDSSASGNPTSLLPKTISISLPRGSLCAALIVALSL